MGRSSFAKLKKNKTFMDLLPPLAPDEREKLKADIKLNGVIDPVIVWKETSHIIDGYHRYDIAKELRFGFPVKYMRFDDEDAVVIWILTHQLGRRNVSEVTRKLITARLYDLLKQPVGGQKPREGVTQNGKPLTTAEKVGEMTGMSKSSVLRAAEFKRNLDAAPPADKPKILAGEMEPPKLKTRRAKPLKEGEVLFALDKLHAATGQIERLIDQMARAYGHVDPKQNTVKETMEIAGLRREFRAWKKNFEAIHAAEENRYVEMRKANP